MTTKSAEPAATPPPGTSRRDFLKGMGLVVGAATIAPATSTLAQPADAFYVFPKAPDGEAGSAFVRRAIDHELLVVPGNVFSERDTHFRISFAASRENLQRGLEIMKAMTAGAAR
jgi:aspartate/methionine/tyrosine aminotransferase